MATIQVQRNSEYNNRLRGYKIFIDGQKAGELDNGDARSIDIAPGQHKIFMKIDWCSSPELVFDIKEGETRYFKTGGNKILRWVMPIAAVIVILGFILRRTTGNYYLSLVVLAPLLVLAYFMTFGRKQYLYLEPDAFWGQVDQ